MLRRVVSLLLVPMLLLSQGMALAPYLVPSPGQSGWQTVVLCLAVARLSDPLVLPQPFPASDGRCCFGPPTDRRPLPAPNAWPSADTAACRPPSAPGVPPWEEP